MAALLFGVTMNTQPTNTIPDEFPEYLPAAPDLLPTAVALRITGLDVPLSALYVFSVRLIFALLAALFTVATFPIWFPAVLICEGLASVWRQVKGAQRDE